VATHAYTVAPGYAELEQGARAFGVEGVREATAWDFNLKIGVRRDAQLGVFGPAYLRTSAGVGVGDLGVAIKFARAVSSRTAVAVVPAVSFPTGDARRGLGAGARSRARSVSSAETCRRHFILISTPAPWESGRGRRSGSLRWDCRAAGASVR